MAKKSLTTVRDDMKINLLAELAKKVVITPEIEAKVWAKVLTMHPYQADELEGFRTEVILTMEEIKAAAVAVGLIAPDDDTHLLTRGDDTVGHCGIREGDVQVISTVGEGKARSSVARKTNGTDWYQFGAVFLYRPKFERTNSKTDSMVDDILKED